MYQYTFLPLLFASAYPFSNQSFFATQIQPRTVKKHQASFYLPVTLSNTGSEKNRYPVTITWQMASTSLGKWPSAGVQLDLNQWIENVIARVNMKLEARLPAPDGKASRLCEAMRYATLGGGKRIRTLLCHAAGRTSGASEAFLDEVSAAIEMMHAYSLVHDDLPAMDDDVLRRGRPTTHVQYDEPTAILAGDALQPQAFLTLSNIGLPAEQLISLIQELATATGPEGMAGGQALDQHCMGRLISRDQLEQMHRMKTGALISAAIRMGALCGKPDTSENAELYAALNAYAQAIGLAFQIVDDLLDATSNTKTLGKTAGKDAAANKPTYMSLLGEDACRDLLEHLRREAHAAIQPLGRSGEALRELIGWIVDREA